MAAYLDPNRVMDRIYIDQCVKQKYLVSQYIYGNYYPRIIFDFKKDAVKHLKSRGLHFQKSSGFWTNKRNDIDYKITQIDYYSTKK